MLDDGLGQALDHRAGERRVRLAFGISAFPQAARNGDRVRVQLSNGSEVRSLHVPDYAGVPLWEARGDILPPDEVAGC